MIHDCWTQIGRPVARVNFHSPAQEATPEVHLRRIAISPKSQATEETVIPGGESSYADHIHVPPQKRVC